MNKTLSYIGIAILFGLAIIWTTNTRTPARQPAPATTAAATDRFNAWAYIAKSKEIAPGETVRLVVIPSPLGLDVTDTKCIVYTNDTLKTSSMVCPDASALDLAEHPDQ